jgi:hypothetical protein
MNRLALVPLLFIVVAGCTEPKAKVALTAHVLKGSTPGAVGTMPGSLASRGASRATVPTTGLWAISPDQAKITISSIAFIKADGTSGASGTGALTDCVVSYSRSTASLTKLLDCPFVTAPGTFVGVEIGVANSFDVLIDDQVNNIYTDPSSSTKLSTTRPTAGPGMVNFSVNIDASLNGVFSQRVYFPAPITVDSGGTLPAVSLVADMIHTVWIMSNAGALSFYAGFPQPAVQVIPSLSGAGRIEYYTSTGTALNAYMGTGTDNDTKSVRVFYATPPQPWMIISPILGPSSAQATNPAKTPVSSDNGFRSGGYAGLDQNGFLCWALPTTFTYQAYHVLRRMQTVSTIGSATIVQTQDLGGGQAPVPTSGDTYASGCPAFTPTDQFTVYLVAK